MDMAEIAKKLGFSESKELIRKAAAWPTSNLIPLLPALMEVLFDQKLAIKLSGMSESAYNRSFNSMQNGIGLKNNLDIKELAIQFGCVRLIPFVHKGLYKDRFLASLPFARRASADLTRPVFIALKVDKHKLIEVAGTSDSEFSSVELLDALPEKRRVEDGVYSSDESSEECS
ncbi:hypothetical protein RD792_015341 [Penstemon davidsonii]|uniref:ORC6 second cyclin-like domain-containing protein n=1 Tax=Penstemon davidsonii TaxID=160366 RepID=A0ABR0CSQ3_9LAMI|nr:hypothetical protein RD792_015341 [Penstemon davidsonii]